MLSRLRIVLVFVVLLALAAAVVWAIVKGVNANPGVVGSLATAGVSVVGGLAVAGYQARVQGREAAARVHREAITPYYMTVINMVSAMAERVDEDGEPSRRTWMHYGRSSRTRSCGAQGRDQDLGRVDAGDASARSLRGRIDAGVQPDPPGDPSERSWATMIQGWMLATCCG